MDGGGCIVKYITLKEFTKEYSQKNKNEECRDVYSITNSAGFIPSNDYFSKDVYSKDLSNYKRVLRRMIAYNPSRINVGSVALQDKDDEVIVSPLYVVFDIDEDIVLAEFLEKFLHSDVALMQIRGLTSGSVRDSLKFSALQKVRIPLINIDKQHVIVENLVKIQTLINEESRYLKKLDLLVKSRFIEMFGDPVSNPYGYDKVALSELADIKIGPFGSLLHKEDYIENGHPLLNPSHIVDGKVVPDPKLTISDGKYEELSAYHLKIGDVVMGRRGEMGRCAVVPSKGYLCGTGSILIRSKGEVTADYIQKIISFPSFKKTIEDMAVGQTMPNLNVPIVANFQVIKPPMEIQDSYYSFVIQVDKSKLAVEKNLEKLELLKKSLMQQYFG